MVETQLCQAAFFIYVSLIYTAVAQNLRKVVRACYIFDPHAIDRSVSPLDVVRINRTIFHNSLIILCTDTIKPAWRVDVIVSKKYKSTSSSCTGGNHWRQFDCNTGHNFKFRPQPAESNHWLPWMLSGSTAQHECRSDDFVLEPLKNPVSPPYT